MLKETLDQLEELEKKATPGDWDIKYKTYSSGYTLLTAKPSKFFSGWICHFQEPNNYEDCIFLKELRNHAKELIQAARENIELKKFTDNHRCSLPDSIKEALNSGDGTYRP